MPLPLPTPLLVSSVEAGATISSLSGTCVRSAVEAETDGLRVRDSPDIKLSKEPSCRRDGGGTSFVAGNVGACFS